jgi:hypothetical protein
MTWRLRGLTFALSLLCLTSLKGWAQTNVDVEEGIRAYTEQGDPREAIRRIGGALDAGNVSAATRARAHMYMAHAFLALTDTVSALPHIQGAVAVFPCLLPAPDLAPPQWVELYEQARPRDAQCEPKVLAATLRSALIPGWGQRTLGRPAASNYFFGFTVGAAASSVFFYTRADQRYSEYQKSSDFLEVAQLYDDAERARKLALAIGGGAVTLYLWNLVDAALSGSAYDRAIADTRSLAVSPMIVPGAGGVLIGLLVPLK